MSEKLRVDDLLVQKGLAESKGKAQALIMAGKVFAGTQRLDKAGKKVEESLELRVEAPPKYVSRGGEKLEAVFKLYNNDILRLACNASSPTGLVCLDVGASTGGFTDCLLQKGAAEVVGIDVGHSQMHPKVKNDPRVKLFEGLNAREMSPEDLPHAQYDIVVMDLAFISQRKVLENVWRFVRDGGVLVSLIKPQFEVTKQEADKCQGVVKDEAIRQRTISEVKLFAQEKLLGCTEETFIDSPIEGGEGNKEYLIVWRKS